MSLQRLAKELQNIASSDSIVKSSESVNIDRKLIEDLTKLSLVSCEINCSAWDFGLIQYTYFRPSPTSINLTRIQSPTCRGRKLFTFILLL